MGYAKLGKQYERSNKINLFLVTYFLLLTANLHFKISNLNANFSSKYLHIWIQNIAGSGPKNPTEIYFGLQDYLFEGLILAQD